MVFKEPRTRADIISRVQQRDALIHAARALDACKVEPDVAGRLRGIAEQMDRSLDAVCADR